MLLLALYLNLDSILNRSKKLTKFKQLNTEIWLLKELNSFETSKLDKQILWIWLIRNNFA